MAVTVNHMDTVGAPSFRERVRARMRDEILDAAYVITVEQGWEQVRMTSLAAQVGVSRQTLYKEFGSKYDVGEALVLREAQRFQEGVLARAERHEDPLASLHAAIVFTLTEGLANPLLRSMLAGAHSGEPSLLPYITTGAGGVLDTTVGVVRDHMRSRHPELSDEDVETLADTTLRLSVSHLLRPVASAETTARRITRLLGAYLEAARAG
jgi:AcrR family transcriptional regulator